MTNSSAIGHSTMDEFTNVLFMERLLTGVEKLLM